MNRLEDDMYRFLYFIGSRKRFFLPLVALGLGMFVLMQALFATQFAPASEIPDSLFNYGPGRLILLIDSLGQAGRGVYLRLDMLDMAFPLVYGLLLATLIILFWGKRVGAYRTASALACIPLLGAAADYAENICVRIVISMFAEGNTAARIIGLRPLAAVIAGYATTIKWSSTAAAIALVLAGIAFSALRRKKIGKGLQ